MAMLIVGVLIWWIAHLLKRAAPGARAAMGETSGKAVMAVALAASVLLMIFGYRDAAFVNVWFPPVWAIHLNNLLMFFAIGLLGVGHSKGRIRSLIRHPMLMAVVVWAVAHLIVNGDLASIILFGGLGAWAVVEMAVLNATTTWTRPAPGPAKRDLVLLAVTIVLYALVGAFHWFVAGVRPFPG